MGGDGQPQFAQRTAGGGLDVDRYNVNMFADLLGASALRVNYRVPFTAQFGLSGPASTATGGPATLVNPNAPGGFLRFGPTPNGTAYTANAAFTNSNLSFVQPLTPDGQQIDAASARATLQALLSRGDSTPEQAAALAQLRPADRERLLANRGALNPIVTQSTNGLAVPTATAGSVEGVVVGCTTCPQGFFIYRGEASGGVVIPAPGTAVGRLKMSEDNSPLTRDRVIFNYDTFGGVPLTASDIAVNRFQFGLEKTLLDGLYSVEVRLPFAGTLASSYTQGSEVKDVEFGNLRLGLKRLLIRSPLLNLSAGLGLTLPTANDQTVLSALDNSLLYRFRNKSVYLEPFVAALYTPTDRLFAQAWTAVNFDVSGSTLTWNRDVFGGTGSARYYNQPLLAVDGQIGYWMVKDGTGLFRGLAPFAELHWNRLLANDRFVSAVNDRTAGQGLSVSAVGGQELNVSAGFIGQVGDNLNLSVGVALPLLRSLERTFDWQLGVLLNYYFGRTARDRSPQLAVGGF